MAYFKCQGVKSVGRTQWGSEPDLAGVDSIVERLVEPNERLALRIVEVDDVRGRDGIVPLANKIRLRVLEGGGHCDLAPQAHQERACVLGQLVDQVCPE